MNNNTTEEAAISESGKAPDMRMKSPSVVYDIFSKIAERDSERSRKRAIIQGQIDGNPPYDEDELKRMGQANRSNVNFREAESIRDGRKGSYFDLLMEVENLVTIKIKKLPKNERQLEQILPGTGSVDEYARIIEEEFTDMLLGWKGFMYHTLLHQEQLITWGVGNCYWENELDWRFKAARAGSFLVPDGALSTQDDLEMVFIKDSYRIAKLFEKIRDPEIEEKSKESGWDIPTLKKLIWKASKRENKDIEWNLGDWERLQQQIKDNDLAYSYSGHKTIDIVHCLVQEYDGTISHLIISQNEEDNKGDVNGNPGKFLFKKKSRYEKWEHAVCLFFANIGEGTYHGVRGLGAKIFAHCVLSDRMLNTVVDGSMAAATILIEPSNTGQKERVRLVRVGPFSVMPEGWNVVQKGTFQPNIEGLVGVKNLLDSNLNRNIGGLYQPDITEDEKTPQAQNTMALRMRATNEAKVERSDVSMYYLQWDCLYTEVMRRALNPKLIDLDPGAKEAQAFKKRCKERGVPEEILKDSMLRVQAKRAIGYGSPVMRSIVTADILGVSPYLKEQGKDNAIRDYVAARTGQAGVERYYPRTDTNNIPTTQHTLANLENNDLRAGQDAIVGVDQPHVIHLIVHMQPLVEAAQMYVNGQVEDVEQLFMYFSAGMKHCAEHIDYISQDPARQNEYRMMFDQFQDLAKVHSQMQAQVEQEAKQRQKEMQNQMQAMQEAQSMVQNGEMQAKLEKIKADTQVKLIQEQNRQQIREAKTLHTMQIQQMLAQHKMSLENAKTISQGG